MRYLLVLFVTVIMFGCQYVPKVKHVEGDKFINITYQWFRVNTIHTTIHNLTDTVVSIDLSESSINGRSICNIDGYRQTATITLAPKSSVGKIFIECGGGYSLDYPVDFILKTRVKGVETWYVAKLDKK